MLARTIREFGNGGVVTLQAEDCGLITVVVEHHAALLSPGDHWRSVSSGVGYYVGVGPTELAETVAQAYQAADEAMAAEQRAIGAVEAFAIHETAEQD